MSLLELAPWRKDKGQPKRETADSWLMPLHQQLDRMFEDFLDTGFPRMGGFQWERGFSPDMDVSETDGQIEVTAELPGIDEKDVDVTLADNVLTVRGEKKSESREEDKDKDHYRLERSYGAFRRSFRLPAEIDADKVTATFDKGVLKIAIAKKETARPPVRKIEVGKGAVTDTEASII